jgi:hypothetical protein
MKFTFTSKVGGTPVTVEAQSKIEAFAKMRASFGKSWKRFYSAIC